jgi:predicted HD phosphohydrolase
MFPTWSLPVEPTDRKDEVTMNMPFTRFADATPEQWQTLSVDNAEYKKGHLNRMVDALHLLRNHKGLYPVDRFEHSLQTATRAHRDGRDEEYVAMCVLHDVGETLAPYSHSETIGAMLKPFLRPDLHWIVAHHGVFMTHHYPPLPGRPRNERDAYQGHELFGACAEFCELYDQESFDPSYDSLDLEFFLPALESLLAKPRYPAR